MPPRSTIVVLVAHQDTPALRRLQARLARAVPEWGPVRVWLESPVPVSTPRGPDTTEWFTDAELKSLGYTRLNPTLTPGSVHHIQLGFFRRHPEFEDYWFIEYDVRLRGPWDRFFRRFQEDDSDLLGCHFRTRVEQPEWTFWRTQHPTNGPLEPANQWRSFLPIFRISRRALEYLDRELQTGWIGHQETLVPTLLRTAGYKITDLGSQGPLTPPEYRGLHYTEDPPNPRGSLRRGTMRYIPPRLWAGLRPNHLYHPVKSPRTVFRWWRRFLGQRLRKRTAP